MNTYYAQVINNDRKQVVVEGPIKFSADEARDALLEICGGTYENESIIVVEVI